MKHKDCKVGMRVKDNLAIPRINTGTGTIIGFCFNVHGQENIEVEWDNPKYEKIASLASENVDILPNCKEVL